jgi:hypothetical protein
VSTDSNVKSFLLSGAMMSRIMNLNKKHKQKLWQQRQTLCSNSHHRNLFHHPKEDGKQNLQKKKIFAADPTIHQTLNARYL